MAIYQLNQGYLMLAWFSSSIYVRKEPLGISSTGFKLQADFPSCHPNKIKALKITH